VDAVIFTDGSFEGDPEWAGSFYARDVGRRYTLAKIVELMKEATQAEGSIHIERLIDRIDHERVEVPPGVLDDLHSKFPLDARRQPLIDRWLKAGGDLVKVDVLSALRSIRDSSAEKTDTGVADLVIKLTDLDEEWLARLAGRP
jgi:hypothetical protein